MNQNNAQEIEIIEKCGYSLPDLERMYEDKSGVNAQINMSEEEAEKIDDENIDLKKRIIELLITSAKAVGHPQNNIFSAISQNQYNTQVRVYAPRSLILYSDAIKQTTERTKQLCDILKTEYPLTQSGITRLFTFCAIIGDCKNIPKSWLYAQEFPQFLLELGTILRLNKDNIKLKSAILRDFKNEVLSLDGAELLNEWRSAEIKNLVSKKIKQSTIQRRISGNSILGECQDPEEFLKSLSQLQSNEKEIKELSSKNEKLLRGYILSNNNTNWNFLESLYNEACGISERLDSIDAQDLRLKVTESDMKLLQSFYGTWRTFSEVKSGVYKIFKIDDEKLTFVGDFLSSQLHMCSVWHENIDKMKTWIQWNAAKKAAFDNGLQNVVYAYENGMPHELVMDAFEKGMYKALIDIYSKKQSEKNESEEDQNET